jgi:hypothetical protein
MRFWKLSTGAMMLSLQAVVCAPTREAAIAAVIADDDLFRSAWERAEVEEVTPTPGAVLLVSSWEG